MSEISGMSSQPTSPTNSATSLPESEAFPLGLPGQTGKGQFGPGGSPAKTSLSLERALGSKAPAAVSGGSGTDSSPNADHRFSSLRTSLLCELEGLTKFSLHWKNSGTPAGRSWWVLSMSGRRTSDSGPSSWPTATAKDHKSTQASQATHDRNSRPLSEVVGLLDQTNPSTNGKPQDWPTPRAEKRACLDSHGKVPLRGSLSADWVTQLQGYPDGWLDVDEKTSLGLWATPSFRR
jgi:hypothetical protein